MAWDLGSRLALALAVATAHRGRAAWRVVIRGGIDCGVAVEVRHRRGFRMPTKRSSRSTC